MKKLLLTLLMSSILTACGGGGGGAGTAETPDGTKINLTDSPKGDVGAETTNGSLYGKNQNDSFYGIWTDDTKRISQVRYQGTKATDIPISGTATYIGESYWLNGLDNEIHKGGKTTLNADFNHKTISGKIEYSFLRDARVQDITLHETSLNGAEFKGRASTLLQDGTYEGALFGKGAKEVAGVATFPGNAKYNTAFGGFKYK